ncbi:vitelline membrane outer layer protein 1-like [Denticeps clupeoides]|nr:vitelline membrane outer layer protein 1-like [Denticeps clupeoides]
MFAGLAAVASVLVLPLGLVHCGHTFAVSAVMVNNGGDWGRRGNWEMCPPGTFARGFSVKVERAQGGGDDTALNGVRLYCSGRPQVYVESTVAPWGHWTSDKICSSGKLTAFQLRVEAKQGDGDDTAANNVRFRCSNGEVMEGDGTSWGSWGLWSTECEKGVCGIQTMVEPEQGTGDDTALNDLMLNCCP